MSNASYPRAERVRTAIREVLAREVERLKDPGVGFVTVTDVTVTRDLRHATAYYTVYGTEVEAAATADGLKRATNHLRSAVAREVRLKFVPTLEFAPDPVPEHAQRIERRLAELRTPPKEDGS